MFKLNISDPYPTNTTSTYRPEIDGLRAFAVIAVILNHFNKTILPSGYLGVDIFFVISGFVITSSLANRPSKNIREFLLGFYTRRIKRLVPALLLFVLLTSVVTFFLNPSPTISLQTGLTALVGFSNIFLLNQATDYFAPATELNSFTHTWSLGVEEQFYLVFPILVWLTGFSQASNRGAKRLFLAIATLSIISLIGFTTIYPNSQATAYFLMPTRFWEMGTGCLLCLVAQRNLKWLDRIAQMPPLLIVAVMGIVMFSPLKFAVLATFAIVILTSVLILCLRAGTLAYKFFTYRYTVGIGLLSYSLYLWHWGILSISRWTIGLHWWSFPFQIALIFLLAWLSYRYFESPLRRATWAPSHWKTISYGLGSIISGAFIISVFLIASLQNTNSSSQLLGIKSRYEDPGILHKDIYCHLPKNINTAFEDCLQQTDKSKRTIYVIGDSHATNHFPSISEALKSFPNFKAKVLSEWGLIFAFRGINTCGTQPSCMENGFQKYLDFFQANLRPEDFIVFSWSRDWNALPGKLPRAYNRQQLDTFKDKLEQIIALVKNKNSAIILVDDIPKTCEEDVLFPLEILQKGNLSSCTTAATISKRDRQGLTDIYLSLVRPGVYYFDPHDYLCQAEQCGILLSGTNDLMYGDASPHISRKHPHILAQPWHDFLQSIGVSRQASRL